MRTHKSFVAVLTIAAALGVAVVAQDLTVPNKPTGTLRFAVIGDSGTGDNNQYRLAKVFTDMHQRFPYEFVLMLGDNMYGGENARDFQRKFEIPYKPVLDKGVKFYASLGNHDSTNQRMYKLFNMNGERFYTFRPKLGVRFFALDSNYMDRTQLQWLEKELAASGSDWKIMYFHHPIYSSGGPHGSDTALREQLEPLFLKYGVDVVMAGHEHFYERLKPQKGIHYFISGGAGKLRKGDVGGEFTEKAFDTGFHFMIFEIDGDQMHFQTISEQNKTVDSGIVDAPESRRQSGAVGAGRTVREAGAAAGQARHIDREAGAPSTAKPAAPSTAKPAVKSQFGGLLDDLTPGDENFGRRGSHRFVVPNESTGFLALYGLRFSAHLKPITWNRSSASISKRAVRLVHIDRVSNAIAGASEVGILGGCADDGDSWIGRRLVESSRHQSIVFEVPNGRQQSRRRTTARIAHDRLINLHLVGARISV